MKKDNAHNDNSQHLPSSDRDFTSKRDIGNCTNSSSCFCNVTRSHYPLHEQQMNQMQMVESREAFIRIQEKIHILLNTIVSNIEKKELISHNESDKTKETIRDISSIATQWTQAKLEKPTLENEDLKADIALKYAETEKILAEKIKIEEETISIRNSNNKAEMTNYLDVLERIIRML